MKWFVVGPIRGSNAWKIFPLCYVRPNRMAPKTFLDKVVASIRALKEPKGSSRQAIQKYLQAEFDTDNATAFKAAIRKGLKEGILVQKGQSFKVNGEEYEGDPEETVVSTDEIVGDGTEAQHGDRVTVSYVGKLADNGGAIFDKATSFQFQLGAGDVIKGWDIGVGGMRVGGRRIIVVPPKLGYGKKGAGKDIPPGATLHFTITLRDVSK